MRKHSNLELLEALDSVVEGHREAKKALIVMLNRSILRCEQRYVKNMFSEYLVSPLKILLLGESGTGKTHLVESLQQIALFPLLKIDATHLNPTGAIGGIKPEELQKMIRVTAMDYFIHYKDTFKSVEEAIERTVVFVDEVDKLGNKFEGSGSGQWNRHVQASFLTLFDNKDEYAGVSFIFAGAFASVRKKKVVKNNLGFFNTKEKETEEILDSRITNSGLIPELVGRINAIIELDVFDKPAILNILKKRIIAKKMIDLAAMGIFDLPELTEEQLDKIAEDCIASKQGVRFLQRAIEKIYLDVEFDENVRSTGLCLEHF